MGFRPGATGGQGIITDGNYGNAQVIEFQPERLMAHLRNDEVAVADFRVTLSEPNTLGLAAIRQNRSPRRT